MSPGRIWGKRLPLRGSGLFPEGRCPMRFLLAGGAGAVSRDLNSALSGIDHEVRVLDTHADTLPISGHEKLELITGKVEDPSYTCSF